MSNFLILFLFKILMATLLPERSCTASFTFPKLPMPNVLASLYGPMRTDDDEPTDGTMPIAELGAGVVYCDAMVVKTRVDRNAGSGVSLHAGLQPQKSNHPTTRNRSTSNNGNPDVPVLPCVCAARKTPIKVCATAGSPNGSGDRWALPRETDRQRARVSGLCTKFQQVHAVSRRMYSFIRKNVQQGRVANNVNGTGKHNRNVWLTQQTTDYRAILIVHLLYRLAYGATQVAG
jgi:hypothetical protein